MKPKPTGMARFAKIQTYTARDFWRAGYNGEVVCKEDVLPIIKSLDAEIVALQVESAQLKATLAAYTQTAIDLADQNTSMILGNEMELPAAICRVITADGSKTKWFKMETEKAK